MNSFGACSTLRVGDSAYQIFRLDAVDAVGAVDRLPYSLKVLLENLLRTEDGVRVTPDDISDLAGWDPGAEPSREIQFTPARVLLQDYTGVPALIDLAGMRDAVRDLGGDPARINPLVPTELVIDHSVIAEAFGGRHAFERNADLEYARNRERFQFLRWAQGAFAKLEVVPPGAGIVHQVNVEHLARVVFSRDGPTPTRWWGPTRTARWSTAWACSAGASAESRRWQPAVERRTHPRPRSSSRSSARSLDAQEAAE
jgi:aconitate hydratase